MPCPSWTTTASVNWSRVLKASGRAITPVTTRLPIGPRTIGLLRRAGLILPVPHPDLAALALADLLATPIEWYFHLALRTAQHGRISLRRIKVPVLFVGGTWDLLAGSRHIATAAGKVVDGEYVELRASHFVPLEQPDRLHELLVGFIARVGAPASTTPGT